MKVQRPPNSAPPAGIFSQVLWYSSWSSGLSGLIGANLWNFSLTFTRTQQYSPTVLMLTAPVRSVTYLAKFYAPRRVKNPSSRAKIGDPVRWRHGWPERWGGGRQKFWTSQRDGLQVTVSEKMIWWSGDKRGERSTFEQERGVEEWKGLEGRRGEGRRDGWKQGGQSRLITVILQQHTAPKIKAETNAFPFCHRTHFWWSWCHSNEADLLSQLQQF